MMLLRSPKNKYGIPKSFFLCLNNFLNVSPHSFTVFLAFLKVFLMVRVLTGNHNFIFLLTVFFLITTLQIFSLLIIYANGYQRFHVNLLIFMIASF